MESATRLTELHRTFVLPSPLKESRPREVRLTGGGRALFVVALLLFTSAIGALIGLSQEARRQAENRRALAEHGAMAVGEVTRLWASGDNKQKVVYRFVAEGQTHQGDIKVSAARRRELTVGSPIAVRFLPGTPDVNDLGGTPRSGMPAALAPIAAVIIGAGGALCLWGIGFQRRLLEEGRVAPAIVTGHATQTTQHGKHRSMTYDFPLLSGAIASGKSATSSKPPAIGSVITVIYDPERPQRNKVYPLSLVEPAR